MTLCERQSDRREALSRSDPNRDKNSTVPALLRTQQIEQLATEWEAYWNRLDSQQGSLGLERFSAEC